MLIRVKYIIKYISFVRFYNLHLDHNNKNLSMKKLIILSILSVFAVGCADNLDTVPEPVNPDLNIELNDTKSETGESPVNTHVRKNRPGKRPTNG